MQDPLKFSADTLLRYHFTEKKKPQCDANTKYPPRLRAAPSASTFKFTSHPKPKAHTSNYNEAPETHSETPDNLHCHSLSTFLAPLHILQQHRPSAMDARQRHLIQRQYNSRPSVCPNTPPSAPATPAQNLTPKTGSQSPAPTSGPRAKTATRKPAIQAGAPQDSP